MAVFRLERTAHRHALEEVDGGEDDRRLGERGPRPARSPSLGRDRAIARRGDGPAVAEVDEPAERKVPGRDGQGPGAARARRRRADDAARVESGRAQSRREAHEDEDFEARRRAPRKQRLATQRAHDDDRRERGDVPVPGARVPRRPRETDDLRGAAEARRRRRRRRAGRPGPRGVVARRLAQARLAAPEERRRALRRDDGAAEAQLEAGLDRPRYPADRDAARPAERERRRREADDRGERRHHEHVVVLRERRVRRRERVAREHRRDGPAPAWWRTRRRGGGGPDAGCRDVTPIDAQGDPVAAANATHGKPIVARPRQPATPLTSA